MIDLEVPADKAVIVLTHEDGRTTISIPDSVFYEAVSRLVPMRRTHRYYDEPSCIYPVEDK